MSSFAIALFMVLKLLRLFHPCDILLKGFETAPPISCPTPQKRPNLRDGSFLVKSLLHNSPDPRLDKLRTTLRPQKEDEGLMRGIQYY